MLGTAMRIALGGAPSAAAGRGGTGIDGSAMRDAEGGAPGAAAGRAGEEVLEDEAGLKAFC